MQVKCDNPKCQHTFTPEIGFYDKSLRGHNVRIGIFKCTECGRVYRSVLYNDELKQKIEEQKQLYRLVGETQDPEKNKELVDLAGELRQEIKKEHAELKKELALYLNDQPTRTG